MGIGHCLHALVREDIWRQSGLELALEGLFFPSDVTFFFLLETP